MLLFSILEQKSPDALSHAALDVNQRRLFRYSCFYCDFDLCLDCKNVWEERNNSRRAKAEKRLRNRVGKIDVTHVVCLKTLCDKVAQIEHSKKLRLKLKVNVWINRVDFSVAKATLQSQMSVSQSVCLSPKPLSLSEQPFNITTTFILHFATFKLFSLFPRL